MSFCTVLENYIEIIGCTGKELSIETGISEVGISRYRQGIRTPRYNSAQYQALIKGLTILAQKKKTAAYNEKKMKNDFESVLYTEKTDFEVFRNNLNILISTFEISISNLAKYLSYDSSYISKIRSGVRKPQELDSFISNICRYMINYYNNADDKIKLAKLINCNINNTKQN